MMRRPPTPSTTVLATGALLAMTACWGSTFFLIKDLLDRVPTLDFLAVRFAVAGLVMVAVAPRALRRLSPLARRRAVVLGAVYGVAQILQTAGLAHTAASVSGFITGLYVVATPLLAAVLLRTRINGLTWAAVALATAGLAVLTLDGIALGGFNVVDLPRLHGELQLPAMVVSRVEPNLEAVHDALLGPVRGGAAKWKRILRAGPVTPVEGLYCQLAGLTSSEAAALIRLTRCHAKLPEPLRAAHLIASGIARGQSRGRA